MSIVRSIAALAMAAALLPAQAQKWRSPSTIYCK